MGATWKSGPHNFTANAYVHRVKNYIGLASTGNTCGQEEGNLNPQNLDADGIDDNDPKNAILPELAYSGVCARFVGLEARGNIRLLEGESTLDLALRGDLVRAKNTSNSQNLPRIAPARIGATLNWATGPWDASVGFDLSAAQNRVAGGDRATTACMLWNTAATWK